MSQIDLHWIDISSCKSVQGNRLLHNGELMIIIIIIIIHFFWVHSHFRSLTAKSKANEKRQNILMETIKGINAALFWMHFIWKNI